MTRKTTLFNRLTGIDFCTLESLLGTPVVPILAAKNSNTINITNNKELERNLDPTTQVLVLIFFSYSLYSPKMTTLTFRSLKTRRPYLLLLFLLIHYVYLLQ